MSKPKKKILVIDDDPFIRESIRLALAEQVYVGIEVTEAIDVDSGIIQLKKIHPDIIILDLHLPDKSGFEFMEIMHKYKHLAKTRVIMLTVDDTLSNIFKAEDKGIDAYYFLGKPFNVSDLQGLVLGILLPSKPRIN